MIASFQPLVYLAVLVLLAIALVLALVPRRLGFGIAWVAALSYGAWMLLAGDVSAVRMVGYGLTLLLTAVGFGIEPLVHRLDLRVRWIDQRTAWGALIGVLIGLFLGGSLLIALLGALIGAMVAELTDRRALAHAFRSGIGAVVAVFGPDGLRLLFTVALISVFISTWGRYTVPAI